MTINKTIKPEEQNKRAIYTANNIN